jgi:aldehyde dehydrogenase (NAD+)
MILIFIYALSYAKFYPSSSPASEPGVFSRLITPQAWTRVNGLLKNTQGTIVLGGEVKEETKYIAPTVVKDVKGDDSLMSEEIFGPVLPIVPVDNVDEAIKFINEREHPLALYVFSGDSTFKNKVFDNTQSGAAVANEVVIHPGADGLPFGGIGPSGSGYHTGKFGFDMFTHLRASMDSPSWIDKLLGARFPPYTSKTEQAITKIAFPKLAARPSGPPALGKSNWWGKWFFLSLALAAVGILTKQRKIVGLLGSYSK